MKRPKSVGEAWRIIVQQEAKIEDLRADAENLRNTITSMHLTTKEQDSYLEEEREKNEKQVRMTMDAHAEIERLRKDRLCRCADEVRCEMKAEIERLTKGWEGLEYEASAQIASLAAAVNTMHKEAIEQEAEIERLQVVISAGIDEVQKVCDNRQLRVLCSALYWHHGPVEGLEDWAVHAADYLPEED